MREKSFEIRKKSSKKEHSGWNITNNWEPTRRGGGKGCLSKTNSAWEIPDGRGLAALSWGKLCKNPVKVLEVKSSMVTHTCNCRAWRSSGRGKQDWGQPGQHSGTLPQNKKMKRASDLAKWWNTPGFDPQNCKKIYKLVIWGGRWETEFFSYLEGVSPRGTSCPSPR